MMGGLQDSLNFYEIMAILLPGFLLVTGVAWSEGWFADKETIVNLSVGGMAVGLAASYVAGFLIQSPAYWLENLYWRLWGGQPTLWVLRREGLLLDKETEAQLVAEANVDAVQDEESRKAKWKETTKRWAVDVRKTPNRLERFLGNYGLARGVAGSAIALGLFLAFRHPAPLWHLFVLALVGLAAGRRMHVASKDYAGELFLCHLQQKT
ncbi:MAG: hypothetical protein LC623_08720 [Halobacteriales archaeon]|nr:hypothetical protein [Halobacteriales archaeon]